MAMLSRALLCCSPMISPIPRRRLLGARRPGPSFATAGRAASESTPTTGDLVPVAIDTSLGNNSRRAGPGRRAGDHRELPPLCRQHRLDGKSFIVLCTRRAAGSFRPGSRTDRASSLRRLRTSRRPRRGSTTSPAQSRWPMRARGPAESDFFILIADMPGSGRGRSRWRRQRLRPFWSRHRGNGHGEKDLQLARSPTKGAGAMKGQMLEPPMKIITAERVK